MWWVFFFFFYSKYCKLLYNLIIDGDESEIKETAERKREKEKDHRSDKAKTDEKEKALSEFYHIDEWHLHDCLEWINGSVGIKIKISIYRC